MRHVAKDEWEESEVSEGVYLADLATGDRSGMKHWRLEPGAELPVHRHHNEQIGYVVSGEVTAIVEGERRQLQAGDSYCFLSEELHGAVNESDEPCVGIGLLTPPRDAPKWGESVRDADRNPDSFDGSMANTDD
jgi:quercetin dioxygenase-like cupin family protein